RFRGALLLRGHLPDAEPDRREGDHRAQRLRVIREACKPGRFQTLTPHNKSTPMSTATAAPTRENVLYEKKGAIAYVTINRPKVLNALNKATIAELNEVFQDARDDAAVRGVILTGAGEKAFAAGADIAEMAS